MFFNGVDANYVPLMEEIGLKWFSEMGEEISDIFSFFKLKSVNCFRVRIWVGDSGPSRLPYAVKIIERAYEAGLKVQPTLFLSSSWADLYKQPEPVEWALLPLRGKLERVRIHVSEVMEKIASVENECAYYQIGNEIDYGICGIFARDKKKRKNIEWLRRHIWIRESEILKEAIKALRIYSYEKPIALHLGKIWDQQLIRSFMLAMDEYGVEYEIVSFSFYPAMIGASFDLLQKLNEISRDEGKIMCIAEYAYPNHPPRGQFWFMNKPSPGYPLTQEGQAAWIKDFLAFCLKMNVKGAFYWSPELYLTGEYKGKIPEPKEAPLTFGWEPMSLFDGKGHVKPSINSLIYGK